MPKYKSIVNKLFDENKSFNKDDFLEFVSDLTGKYPNNIISHPANVDSQGNKYFREDLSIFEDSSGEKIAILIYKMPSSSKVEKARSHQRNLISNYLKNEGVYEDIDNVLVAFYSDNNPDWRLSFVKQEFKLNSEKTKIINELTPAKRFSFLIESNSKNITVKQRLNSLIDNTVNIKDIENVFSVEKVSKEFFDQYVKLYEKLVHAFKEDKVFLKIESESNNGDENFRENFVKKLLGQIVFLYFLQKKGWLGVPKDGKWGEGNKSFMQDLLAECLSGGDDKKELGGKNFFNDYLEHLFYDNLNLKRENDYSEYFDCRIPYLNGGLFEPINNYNWKGFEYVVLSGEENNLLFKKIFDTFDEYNFTVYENDPLEQDVAVDPEMLGKVFENLLPENERKGKGAFYTPREIVHYMCKESLKNHIINKTGISEEKINGLFERKDSMYNSKKFGNKLSETERYEQFGEFIDYAENIVNSLKTVKIVDPAVGSGAFPMGLLKEIVSLRKYLQENILLEDNISEYQIKKETLENCIYGVDLDPGAVEIAKLRFWLSLVIEEESSDKIDPLPNLDYKIMQGNSLIEDVVVGDTVIKLDLKNNTKKLTKKEETENKGGIQSGLFSDSVEREEILKKLKYFHKIFFQEKDNNKKKQLKEKIDHIEKELIRISGEVEVNKIQKNIEAIEGKYLINGGAWEEKDAKKIAEWQNTIASIKAMEEKYKRDNIRSFFPWKLHFGEVFNDNGGFDIVIGNPPYVRHEEIKEFKPIFAQFFETYAGTADLYCYFYELIGKLLKDNGHGSYITSNKWIKAKYGENIRNYFKTKTKINEIIDFGGFKVFDTATVDSNIIGFNKGYKDNNELIVINISNDFRLEKGIELYKKEKGFLLSQNKLGVFSWSLIQNNILKLKEKIENQSVIIKNLDININYGIKTGFNEAFIIDNQTRNRLIKEDSRLNSIIIPILRGKDLFKFGYKYKDLYLINTHNGLKKEGIKPVDVINDYPKLYEYFLNINNITDGKVEKRSDKGDHWSNLRNCAYLNEFKKKKIIYPELISTKCEIYLDNDGFFTNNAIHLITSDTIDVGYIYCLLVSKLFFGFYKGFIVNTLGKGGFKFNRVFVEQFPIKQISEESQKPFIDLVNQILEITKSEDYLEREDLQKQVKVLEKQIDDMVYKLYELTPEEIELVEESLR